MNIYAVYILALTVVGSFFLHSTYSCFAQAVSNIKDGTVYVRVAKADGSLLREGSGVILADNGYIFTAKHLFDDFDPENDKITVSLKGSKEHPISAQKYPRDESTTDISLLYINSVDLETAHIKQYFKLSCDLPSMLEPIQVAGFPAGKFNSLVVLPGVVSADGLNAELKGLMRVGIAEGMSGGPVFWRGYVIGLVYGSAGALEAFTPIGQSAVLRSVANVDCFRVTKEISQQASVIKSAPNVAVPDNSSEAADSPNSSKPKLFIQVSSDVQKPLALRLASKLSAIGVTVAAGIENVGNKAPSSGQVRYFSDLDGEAALRIENALNADSDVKFKAKKVSVQNGPRNVIELWLPKFRS